MDVLESIDAFLRVLLDVVGAANVADPTALAFTVAAAAAVAGLALACSALELPTGPPRISPHPRRAIDVSTRVAQSHPDAPGHSRPRAPGVAA